jgi:hypothetical protein
MMPLRRTLTSDYEIAYGMLTRTDNIVINCEARYPDGEEVRAIANAGRNFSLTDELGSFVDGPF